MQDFDFIDPRFNRFIMGNAPVEKLATGMRWAEGPVWISDAGCLLFSDIPNDRIMRWIDGVGLSVYRQPSNYANGHTRDREGRLISCEHGTRRVTRTEHDGTITVIADAYQGKRLNSPNDVVVKSDGSIWFSDPHYGIMIDYEGFKSEQELPCNVYRADPATGSLDVVIDDFYCPNGLCFSPDEKRLYVAETNAMFEPDADRHIRVFDVTEDGRTVSGGDVFYRTGCRLRRWISRRRGRPYLDERGRRRPLRLAGGRPARQGADPRSGRQRHLRRSSRRQEPPLHLRHHVALRGLPEHPGRADALSKLCRKHRRRALAT